MKRPLGGNVGGAAKRVAQVKSQLCRHFLENPEGCQRGSSCSFAHGDEELGQPIAQTEFDPSSVGGGDDMGIFGNVRLKTALCRHWQNRGECALGAGCGFAHGEDELGTPQPQERVTFQGSGFLKTKLCRHFENGHCDLGELCSFAHGAADLGTQQANADQGPGCKKTQLCRHFINKGHCDLGDQCGFAHGEHEIGTNQSMGAKGGGGGKGAKGIMPMQHMGMNPFLGGKAGKGTGGKGHKPGYVFKKTQLCRHWESKGECSLGDRCNFAHGEDELGQDQSSQGDPGLSAVNAFPPCEGTAANPAASSMQASMAQFYASQGLISGVSVAVGAGGSARGGSGYKKTQLCRHWASKGQCGLGDACNFAHGEEELGTAQPTPGNPGLSMGASQAGGLAAPGGGGAGMANKQMMNAHMQEMYQMDHMMAKMSGMIQ